MITATKAEFARHHGVDRSTVNTWETKDRLVTTVDGPVNVESSERLPSERATIYRGGQAKGPTAQQATRATATEPATPSPSDPMEMAEAGLTALVREIGAYAGRRAVEFGAPLQVADALDTAISIEAAGIAERFLTEHGHPDLKNGWSPLKIIGTDFAEADGRALAEQAGVAFDQDVLIDRYDRHNARTEAPQ